MSAAESGDDGDPRLARGRRATGRGDPALQRAGEARQAAGQAGAAGRPQQSPFEERDADFNAIRDIIAKASQPGAVAADQAAAGRTPPPGPAAEARRPAPRASAAGPAAGDTGQKRASSSAAEAARSVLRASGEPAPVPPPPPPVQAAGGRTDLPPPAGAADVVLRQKGTPPTGGGGHAGGGGRAGGGGSGPRERGGHRRRGGWLAVSAIILVLLLAVGAGAWYGTQTGLIPLGGLGPGGGNGDLPLVTAEEGPAKVRPEDRGGITIPDQDKQIYQRLAGSEQRPAGEERMLAPPETALQDAPPQGPAETVTAAVGEAAEEEAGQDLSEDTMPGMPQGETLADAVGAEPALEGGPFATGRQPAAAEGTTMAADRSLPGTASSTGQSPEPAREGRSDGVENLLPSRPAPNTAAPAPATMSAGTGARRAETDAPQPVPAPPSVSDPQPAGTQPAGETKAEDIASADKEPENLLAEPAEEEPEAAAAGNASAAPAQAASDSPASDSPASDAPSAKAEAAPPAALPPGAILLQLAALRDDGAARSEWRRLQGRYAGQLGGMAAHYERVEVPGKGMFTRIQAGPFATAAAAEAACAALKAAGQGCFLVRR